MGLLDRCPADIPDVVVSQSRLDGLDSVGRDDFDNLGGVWIAFAEVARDSEKLD